MKIVYCPAAVSDIQTAADYISNVLKKPAAADTFRGRILTVIALLRDNPFYSTGAEISTRQCFLFLHR